MKIKFTKMQGSGNDFMVIDAIRQTLQPTPELIRAWADRRTGIGFDQLLLAAPTQSPQADFFYRIFNADGSEAANCGNGARCLARFLQEEQLTTKNPIVVETLGGLLELALENNHQVTVDMGTPTLEPALIPFKADKPALTYSLTVEQTQINFCALAIGNPHAVLVVDNVAEAPVAHLGQLLTNHPLFPQGANIGFMQIMDREHIRLRVYERGVGETLACGSGACAAVVAGNLLDRLDRKALVQQSGGDLTVYLDPQTDHVYLTGPAIKVYEGQCEI